MNSVTTKKLIKLADSLPRYENLLVRLLLKFGGKYEDEWKPLIEEKSKGNKKPFNSWFDGTDRIYIPFGIKADSVKPAPYMEEFFKAYGYRFDSYLLGTVISSEQRNPVRLSIALRKIVHKANEKLSYWKEILKLAEENNLDQVEYILKDDTLEELGISKEWLDAFEKGTSKGIVIKNLITTQINYFDHQIRRASHIEEDFNSDKNREPKGLVNLPLFVVISQNPHDIAKMSYERNWSSCLTLGTGEKHKELFCEVEDGGLIAYIIKQEDKNIEKPYSRIHIRHLQSKEGKSIAKSENRYYGIFVPGFFNVVNDFINSHQEISLGIYSLKGSKWSDSVEPESILTGKEPPSFDEIKNLINQVPIIELVMNISGEGLTEEEIDKLNENPEKYKMDISWAANRQVKYEDKAIDIANTFDEMVKAIYLDLSKKIKIDVTSFLFTTLLNFKQLFMTSNNISEPEKLILVDYISDRVNSALSEIKKSTRITSFSTIEIKTSYIEKDLKRINNWKREILDPNDVPTGWDKAQ